METIKGGSAAPANPVADRAPGAHRCARHAYGITLSRALAEGCCSTTPRPAKSWQEDNATITGPTFMAASGRLALTTCPACAGHDSGELAVADANLALY